MQRRQRNKRTHPSNTPNFPAGNQSRALLRKTTPNVEPKVSPTSGGNTRKMRQKMHRTTRRHHFEIATVCTSTQNGADHAAQRGTSPPRPWERPRPPKTSPRPQQGPRCSRGGSKMAQYGSKMTQENRKIRLDMEAKHERFAKRRIALSEIIT